VDGGHDLAAMAHDAAVGQQALDLGGAKPRYLFHLEAGKTGAKCRAFVQDGQPAQAGLKTFQADVLV
jgi:hypothetical protein